MRDKLLWVILPRALHRRQQPPGQPRALASRPPGPGPAPPQPQPGARRRGACAGGRRSLRALRGGGACAERRGLAPAGAGSGRRSGRPPPASCPGPGKCGRGWGRPGRAPLPSPPLPSARPWPWAPSRGVWRGPGLGGAGRAARGRAGSPLPPRGAQKAAPRPLRGGAVPPSGARGGGGSARILIASRRAN